MRLNWLAYTYTEHQGYGKYSNRMVAALRKQGVTVRPELAGAVEHAPWLLAERDMHWDCPTISCMPPYHLLKLPPGAGPHWMLTMTEGGALPEGNKDPEKGKLTPGWAETINKSNVQRLIVPCEHNAEVFRKGGVDCPISVIWGGTDPDEFPLWTGPRPERPYTFLALADRGDRKGWYEVYAAFYLAFGGITTGDQDVRLIVKCRPEGNELIDMMVKHCPEFDHRLTWLRDDVSNMRELYKQVDCFAIPSRSEGWGMPHREAAMMGLPVITQAFSGMDDGHTHEWAIVVEKGQMCPIQDQGHMAGEWRVADVRELAATMRHCYENEWQTRKRAKFAREWLKTNQTWDHAASALIRLMEDEGLFPEEVTMEMEAMTWPT